MKHKIIKLPFLFLTICVLASSRDNGGIKKVNGSLNVERSCLRTRNEYAFNTNCKKQAVVKDKSPEAPAVPEPDNELPLSHISRFILLQ